jgi:IclR family acetate operon transcriptional repressor
MARIRRPKINVSADTSSPIARVFSVLELAGAAGAISVATVVSTLGIPRPSAHRIVASLEELGYLQKLPGRSGYGPAPRLVGLAADILSSTIVYAAVQMTLADLARRIGETCSLAVMSGGEVEYIASAYGNSPLTLQFQAGQRTPLHCTSSGRVFLASLSDARIASFLATGPWQPITPYTTTDPKALKEELVRVRAQDYAMNDSEFIVGVVGAAVPVRSEDNRVLAALTISAPKIRMTLERLREHVPAMKSAAAKIARSM